MHALGRHSKSKAQRTPSDGWSKRPGDTRHSLEDVNVDSARKFTSPLGDATIEVQPDGSMSPTSPTMPMREAANAWMKCATALKEYDEAKIQGWKEEIDTHLVFAGLFSAILTAFNVEAYKLLIPQDQSSNSSASSSTDDLLRLLIANMAQSNGIDLASPANSSSSQESSLGSGANGFTQSRAALINGLWFSSLICSLAAASISLMAKQWLNQYTSGMAGVSPEIARLRQYRYDNLRKWKVAEIMMLLPMLLQGALVLFLVGLVLFLFPINKHVAIVATVLVALLLFFIFVTTVLPTFMPDCSYQSPQAWAIFVVIQTLKKPARGFARWIAAYANQIVLPHADGSLRRLRNKFAKRVVQRLSRFADKPNSHSWKAREWVLIDDKDASLDQRMLVVADRTLLDDTFLRDVVEPCLDDMAPSAAVQCYYDIMAYRADRVVGTVPYFDENKSSRTAILTNVTLNALAKTREEETLVEHRIRILRTIEPLLVGTLPLTYYRFCRVLFSLLDDRDTAVRHLAFKILYHQLSRNLELSAQHASSGCHDLGAVVSFMSKARKDNDIKHFLDACDLVISLATLPAVNPTGQGDVRAHLQDTLVHLQDFFQTPLWKNDPQLLYPISRIAPHLVALETRYPRILEDALVDVLGDVAGEAERLNHESRGNWEDKIIILKGTLEDLQMLKLQGAGSSQSTLTEERSPGKRKMSLMRTPLDDLNA